MIRLFVRHPNAANLLMAAMLVAGVFAVLNLTTRFWPPANLNQVEITIAWPGASAEDVADGILDAVEPQVRFLPDVDDVVSYAREGGAFTSVNFEAGTDMQQALSRVEQAVDSITTLPEDSETPSITFDEMFDPVGKIGISGPFPEASLQLFAKRVRDDLLDRGLEKITLRGLRTRELIVEAREHDLLRLGLTPQDIAAAIRRNTDDRPSGVLDGVVDQQIRVLAVEETVASIANIEIQTLPNGDVLRVGDVANVIDGFARSSVSGQRGGNPAVELSIERAQSDDALESDRIVREYLEEAKQTLPRSLNLQLYDVRTETLWERISILIKNGGQGLAVVLLVLFIFLDARIAFWVAVGIPVAFAGTLAAMFVTGQSVNMISLFALIMMLGVIVDDAIVVGEHTATLTEQGVPPAEAARRGAEEMLMPVMASSITTIAAFGPLFMMRDVMGQMFSAIPLVAIAIIVASVIECFLILPGHLAHAWGKPSGLNFGRFFRLTLWAGLGATLIGGAFTLAKRVIDNPETAQVLSDLPLSLVAVVAILLGLAAAGLFERRRAKRAGQTADPPLTRLRRAFDRHFNAFRDGGFDRFVRLTFVWRWTTAAASAGILTIVIYGLYLGGEHLRFVFFPSPEAEFLSARIEFVPGTPRERVIEGVAEVERALQSAVDRIAPTGERLVADVYTLLGRAGRDRGDNLATLSVQLTPSENRTIRTPDIRRAWRKEVPSLPGIKRISVAERRGGPPGRDVDLRITGGDATVLKAAANDAADAIALLDGVSAVTDDLPLGKPEVALRLTPRGASLGFTLESVGEQVRSAFEGDIARRIADDGEEIPIRVRLRSGGEPVPLHDLYLRAPSGAFVPLTEIVTFTERATFSIILRRDGVTTITVYADVDNELITPQEVTDTIAATILPRLEATYAGSTSFEGRAKERARSFEDLRQGALLAAVMIYITLAFVFGSYWRPVVIMLIIPFGAVGAMLGHAIMGMNLTIVSFAGLLGLAGILVNDSIILVRRFDERLAEGEDFTTAAIGASRDRLRAVLLTSLTTIGGLVPLLFETSLSAQFLLPMAVTIVFGLAAATVLVLILVPTLIGIGFDIGRLFSFLLGKAPNQIAKPPPAE